MEAQKEAQRIMTMSVWKMYHSRMQRGGLRLHRSLQLSLVMRSARELYLSAKVETDEADLPFPTAALAPAPNLPQPMAVAEVEADSPQVSEEAILAPEPMETQEARETEKAPACSHLPPVPYATLPQRPMKANRKRRSSSLGQGGETGLVPSKKARLEEETAPAEAKAEVEAEGDLGRRQSQVEEGPFPSLARVLQKRFSGILSNTGGPPKPTAPPPSCELKPGCRQADNMINILVRTGGGFLTGARTRTVPIALAGPS
ncbi:immediate early response gene 2 protein [Dromiciops gliroides]|uniref:immediate early response gene 2 protein n=1 Tax=Dromiciops gliroides TaxID=33562 RepID=UPI001CC55F5A|nr:immediate early response gene 2 protein [Dromiciops gliroides]